MFTFDTGLAELLYAIGVIGYFVDGGALVVCVYIRLLDVFVISLRIEGVQVGFILSDRCSLKINSIYKLRGLNHSCIADMP